ncbi:hypothetical protein PQX77_016194 [Marasmius sp. AFHP31]|nr:hypothetical protein PQX77_016194 [Marasmius sp. AFHP31]
MSSTTPSIPSTTTIPILHGQDNFAQWHEAATGMIQNLGLNLWICGPTPENVMSFNPNIVPVYPPSMSNNPTPEEYQIWQVFWARDGVATFVLTSHLSPNIASMLLPNLDPTTDWAEAITRFLALLPNHPVWEQLRKMGSDATATNPLSLNHDSWEFIANSVLCTDADR